MKFVNGDITSVLIGYIGTSTKGPLMGKVYSSLLEIVPAQIISHGVLDEFVRGVGALVLAVASRYLYSKLEKIQIRKKKKEEPSVEPIILKPIKNIKNDNEKNDTSEIIN